MKITQPDKTHVQLIAESKEDIFNLGWIAAALKIENGAVEMKKWHADSEVSLKFGLCILIEALLKS